MVARLVSRMLTLPENDSEAREGFVWQLEAVRRHVRELPGDVPESAHLGGIAESVTATARPTPGLRLSLTAYAYFLEHDGRLEEALDALSLAGHAHGPAMTPAEFAGTALFAGRLNRLLARWEAASNCYASAESAARLTGDTVTALRSRLGRHAVLRGQGNLPLAKAGVEDVIRESEALNLRDVLTIAYADLGALCELQGHFVEAAYANYRAFLVSEDAPARMRVLGDLGIDLLRIGAFDSARLAFEIVIESKASFLVRTNALLELMDLESVVGNEVAFRRRRAQAEDLRERMPPSMSCDFHFKTGTGLARFGRITRARELLLAGQALAEKGRLHSWYFRFEQAIAGLAAGAPTPAEPTTRTVSDSPAIQEVAVGLREYALQAT